MNMQNLQVMFGIGLAAAFKLYTDYYTEFKIINENYEEYEQVLEHCPTIRSKQYKPTVFLPTPMTQIVYSLSYEKHPNIRYEEHDVITRDGGKLQLFCCVDPPVKETKSNKVIVIFHGHTYGAGAKYT